MKGKHEKQSLLFAFLPGLLHHKGDKMNFSSRFGQGSIIGVHLDTWHGTLTFFKNRKCIGESCWTQQRPEISDFILAL